jgi:hypothetical protein
MILRHLFSCVPFVLLNLRAPDAATGGGGASTEAPKFESPAWAPADKAPEVTGDSIENKLESSNGIIGKLFTSLKTAFTDFKKLWDEKQEVVTQFDALTASFQKEKDDHTATKGLLETEKGEHTKTKGEFDKSKKSVERLEKLCDLKGIDKNQVVAPDTQTQGNDVVAQYKQLKADEKEGKVAQGAAHKFYRKNKKAIDEAGE